MSSLLRLAITASAVTVIALGAASSADATTGPAAANARQVSDKAVRPLSANGCAENFSGSDQVCIDVEGSGLHVDLATASELRGPGSFCAVPSLWANGSLLDYGTNQCNSYNINYEFDLNINLPNNTKLCVTWSDSSEEPCETVHS